MSGLTNLKLPAAAGVVGIAAAVIGIVVWDAPTHAAGVTSSSPSRQAASGHAMQSLPWARDELLEPKLFQSDRGVLDVLMVAQEIPVDLFFPYRTNAWVYEICPRPANGDQCPKGSASDNEYGGTRLQVEPGDTLKIRLVNKLPIFTLPTDPDAPVNPNTPINPKARGRSQNPTSLHTHGLLVSPHAALREPSGQTVWGDNAFARVFNLANGTAPDFEKMMGPVVYDHINYSYDIPATHPSGLFWFHPHAHGLTQAQITSGLSGVLTIGHVADEYCRDATCHSRLAQVPERHLLLKDSQIESDESIRRDQDTGFCAVDDSMGSTSREHQGGCDGTVSSPVSGADHSGGRWFYTINGQVYPSITVGNPTGQVWRLTNASANTTYDLNLWLPDERRQMAMQILSIDGVSVGAPPIARPGQRQTPPAVAKGLVTCPSGFELAIGFCTMRLHMMPASRAEVWVGYRDAQGFPRPQPAGAHAILRTPGFQTGPTGDNFPAIDLAKVDIQDGQVAMQGDSAVSPHRIAATQAAVVNAFTSTVAAPARNCGMLAPGHMRRIFLNVPKDPRIGATFGLGYEELDAHGNPVPGTFVDVRSFDHMNAPLCLSLAPGNQPEVERWQLVNLAGEDHSFHVHQVRFSVVSAPTVDGTVTPPRIGWQPSLIDSLPLPHADGECGSVDNWRRGACTAHVATVQIPFTIAGDYLYHCHVLEHEDGGMMAAIRVLPNNAAAARAP